MTYSFLHVNYSTLNPDLIKLINVGNGNAVVRYDDGRTKNKLDFLDSVLIENIWEDDFNIPTIPTTATTFFYKQFLGIAQNIDRCFIPGGFDLFKYACWERGLVNDDMSYTKKGQELIDLLKSISISPKFFDHVTPPSQLVFSNPVTANLSEHTGIVEKIFGRMDKVEKINKTSALLCVGIIGDFLLKRQNYEHGSAEYDKLLAIKNNVFAFHGDELRTYFRILNSVLKMEAHNVSTLGALNNQRGIIYQNSLVQLFNNANLFEFCLG